MNGLDLFSGIGGISLALEPWVRTIAYCEQDRYAQGVLISRMRSRELEQAPIWDDVRTLRAEHFGEPIDIIFGGFPCQDISTAGRGAGLEGERSGLFFEIIRLVRELRPEFIFLENVPAISTRGGLGVTGALAELRYDCRWTNVSAAELGAPLDDGSRWFLMAKARRELINHMLDRSGPERNQKTRDSVLDALDKSDLVTASRDNWVSEPAMGRVVNGLSNRVDRVRCLGNSVVPLAAREAFKRLIGVEKN